MPSIAFVITTPPTKSLTLTALNLVREAANKNIEVMGVFFYQSGVLNASSYITTPSDEYPITKSWQNLASEHKVPLYLCATAAEKYGLLDAVSLADKTQNLSSNISAEFTVSGLAELVTLTINADRVVQL